MIAYLEFSHTVTNAFHKPSTVRHGDTAIGHTIGHADNSIVMEVERTCMQSYPDCSRPGCSRIGQFDTFNPVKAAWRSDDDGLQVGLQFKREATSRSMRYATWRTSPVFRRRPHIPQGPPLLSRHEVINPRLQRCQLILSFGIKSLTQVRSRAVAFVMVQKFPSPSMWYGVVPRTSRGPTGALILLIGSKAREALVVGAGVDWAGGWGNGKATAVAFAREGARVFCADRTPRQPRKP